MLSARGRRAGFNSSFFSNPEYEQTLARAETETDPARRGRLFDRLERIIDQQRPWLPLAYVGAYVAVRGEVRGVRVELSGLLDLDLTKARFRQP